jgi:hypothetical protein
MSDIVDVLEVCEASMPTDLFEFWSSIVPSDRIHPADSEVLRRIGDCHDFNLDCLPSCFMGPLRAAPVVLLFLSPGFKNEDLEEANSESDKTDT